MTKTKKIFVISFLAVAVITLCVFGGTTLYTSRANQNSISSKSSLPAPQNVKAYLEYHSELEGGDNIITLCFDKPENVTKVRLFLGKDTKDNWIKYRDYFYSSESGYYQIELSSEELKSDMWKSEKDWYTSEPVAKFEDNNKYYFQLCSLDNDSAGSFSKYVDVIPCPMWGKQ